MKISFKPLSISSFPLLLKWLITPHVKQWWDRELNYTVELVKEKYTTYVEGYKVENGNKKAISAFIIYLDNKPIGYIQIYNAYDFLKKKPLEHLPRSLGAIDSYIGEEEYLRKGIGSNLFYNLEKHLKDQGYKIIQLITTDFQAPNFYKKLGFICLAEIDRVFAGGKTDFLMRKYL